MTSENLLFEIGTEELPAGYIAPALARMREVLAASLRDLDLAHGVITTDATPRRLTIFVASVATRQADREEEVSGPPASVAYKDGALTRAGEGF